MKLTVKKIIVIVILTVLVSAAVIFYLYMRKEYGAKPEVDFTMITTNMNYDVKIVKQEEEVTYLAKESGGDFKVLAFTDMHLDGLDKAAMDKTMEKFQKAIDEEHPDLIILTGDIVPAIFNKERAIMLAEVMEKYGIYWCPILGNHEGEHPLSYSRKNLIKLWSNDKKYPHCLMEPGPEGIYGYGNYVVNLQNSEQKISQSLIFMDSGDNVSKEDINKLNIKESFYDYIKADQIEWYKDKIKALPEGTKSSLFIHIPLCEYAAGWEAVYDPASGTIKDTKDCTYISGMQREAVCCCEYNSGLFDVMLSLGSTQAVYCGHDHVNDYSIVYKGIELNYLQASGYTTTTYGWNDITGTTTNILEKQTMQGYTILKLKENGEHEIIRVRYEK